jgi:WD40 repeat protein
MPTLTPGPQRLRPRACPRSLPARSVCAHAHAHAHSRPAASAPSRMPTLTPGPQRLRPRACPRSLPARSVCAHAHAHAHSRPAASAPTRPRACPVAFRPSVPYLATGCGDETAKMWLLNVDCSAPTCVCSLPEHSGGIFSVVLNPSSLYLATVCFNFFVDGISH